MPRRPHRALGRGIGTRGDYVEQEHTPDGIEHVLINGAWAIRQGRFDQAICSGQPLRV